MSKGNGNGVEVRPSSVPKATGITNRNIESAFIFRSRYQRRRIRAYGKMSRDVMRSLGAEIVLKYK